MVARFGEGPNPFDGGDGAGPVRHVAPIVGGNTLDVFFSGIGDAPERISLSIIELTPEGRNGNARRWRFCHRRVIMHPPAFRLRC